MALDPSLVDRALAEATKRAENLDYFFDRLRSPDWIEPLRERGFLSEPPEQFVDEQGYIHAPGWSASRYLARMAALAPGLVLKTIEEIDTNNERVQEGFVDAALAMPAEEAQRLASRLVTWIANREQLCYLLPRKTTQLICKLSTEGATETAIELLRVVFEPLAKTSDQAWRPMLRARFDEWEYDHHLQRILAEAAPAAPTAFLSALADLLGDALALLRQGDEADADFSRIWRVRIHDDRDRATEVEEALISIVRDAAVALRRQHLLTDTQTIELLTAHPEELFRRIVMHTLVQDPEPELQAILPFALDLDELLDGEPSPEFRELLTATAPRLTASQLEELSAAILNGPDVERFRELSTKYDGREPSVEDTDGYVARWRIGRLALIADALPPEARAAYDALVAEHGEAKIPLSWEIHSFTGPNSPLSVDELALKSDDELLVYLREWEPGAQRGGEPSIEGLARALSELTERDPMRISQLAPELVGTRPAYAQWIMQGFEAAIREQRGFDWQRLLDLLDWIVAQPREIPGGRGDDYSDLDPGWVWARREIAGLLERGLRDSGGCAIPFAERDRIWKLIEAISADPNPTRDEEKKYGGENMDPATLALNTTRPRALRAALAYAIWVYQQLFGSEAGAGRDFFTTQAPEVAALLEMHVGPEHDPSTASRSVYGESFANLIALDPDWTTTQIPRIFPSDDTPLRAAAWGSYVIYTPPYTNVFELLRDVYRRSAELSSADTHGFRWMNGAPAARLGEHLSALLWRGTLTTDDDLFVTFWNTALPATRAHTIAYLGRSARDAGLGPDLQQRLMTFWAWAKQNVRVGDESTELREFAWWFGAQNLPPAWRLAEADQLLRNKTEPEPAFLVAQALPELVADYPRESLSILRLLLEQGGPWDADAWREEIETILQATLRSDDTEVTTNAQEVLDWLLARGHRNFRAVIGS